MEARGNGKAGPAVVLRLVQESMLRGSGCWLEEHLPVLNSGFCERLTIPYCCCYRDFVS